MQSSARMNCVHSTTSTPDTCMLSCLSSCFLFRVEIGHCRLLHERYTDLFDPSQVVVAQTPNSLPYSSTYFQQILADFGDIWPTLIYQLSVVQSLEIFDRPFLFRIFLVMTEKPQRSDLNVRQIESIIALELFVFWLTNPLILSF